MDVTGVTLPGTPAVVAGSNGQIAWGFTNSYGDFADVRFAKCVSPDYGVRREHIAVRGADAAEVEYRDAGPAVVLDGEAYADDVARGECLQAAWLATRPEATNFGLLGLERARTVDDALALAPGVGIPGQNLVVGRHRRAHRLDLVRPCAARHGAGSPVRRARIPRRDGSSAHCRSAGRPALDRKSARGGWTARGGTRRR